MIFNYVHAGFMTVGFLVLFGGFTTARYLKNKIWWLKVHKVFGVSGASLTILGFFTIAFKLSLSGRPHITMPHAYVGLVIVFLAVVMPALGFIQLKIGRAGAKIRPLHRLLGWIMLLFMVINILFGMYMVGGI